MKLEVLLLLVSVTSSFGYHILTMFPAPSHSHNSLGKGIVDALLKGGHTVTWVTPFPEKVGKNPSKNLNIIDISPAKELVKGIDMTQRVNRDAGIAFVKQFAKNISLVMMGTPAVREAILKQKFDAVVTEAFFSDVLAGIAAVLQVPWIQLAAPQMYPHLEAQVDEVRSVSTIPLMFNPSETPMPFIKRLVNLALHVAITVNTWLDHSSTVALYEELFKPLADARGVALPPFDAAYHNVSIMLINSHESIAPAFSTPPNVVNIAGYHMEEEIAPLPKDLQSLLDSSPQGVLYFSMGSVLRSASFPADTRAALLKVFASLPFTVLWKFEEPLENLPKNVHVRTWLPQTSVLAHPNIKLFITHGGQLSTLEAIRAGVPLLAVPVFGDQPSNAERARVAGYARRVDFSPDMVPEIEVALKDMLADDKYAKRAQYLSKLFQSRPSKPAHLINHYVTLAIETKGAYHLRSLSLLYSWYERWFLDVLALLLALVAILVVLVRFLIRRCVSKVSGKKHYKDVKLNKKKRN